MKSLKYIALIGLLCAGLATLARATVIDLGERDVKNNGDATETAAFIAAGGDPDAVLCFKDVSPGPTDFGGSITFSVNADDTLHVIWNMTGTGQVVCGFLTKDGDANLVHIYSVSGADQLFGSADLIVPGNGADSLSHLDVFCCAGGTTVPDGGSTVMLLGSALTGFGLTRRYLKR